MHSSVTELEQLTLQMVQRLDDAHIDDFVYFVNQREKMIQTLIESAEITPLTASERTRLEQIMSYEAQITDKMNLIKVYAASKLSKLTAGLTQRNGYNHETKPQSYFFDSRK